MLKNFTHNYLYVVRFLKVVYKLKKRMFRLYLSHCIKLWINFKINLNRGIVPEWWLTAGYIVISSLVYSWGFMAVYLVMAVLIPDLNLGIMDTFYPELSNTVKSETVLVTESVPTTSIDNVESDNVLTSGNDFDELDDVIDDVSTDEELPS